MTLGKLLSKMANMSRSRGAVPFTIAVEGNVGSGKTTFLNYIQKVQNVTVINEPVEEWRNCNGHNLLSLMYDDPKKWSFTFQSYVQLTMLKNHTMKVDTPIKLMERSIFSARHCFVEKQRIDGKLPLASYAVVDKWFQWICRNNNVNVDLFVYLRTTPEVAYRRVLHRNRSEEKTIPFEYIESLHEIHEDWLINKRMGNCSTPVFTIDADLDLASIGEQYGQFEEEILKNRVLSIA